MPKEHAFSRDEVFPSWWPNALQEWASSFVSPNLHVAQLNPTTVRVPAGPGDDLVALAIDGKLRWRTSNVDRAHPGGAAGTYRLWAVCSETAITNVPDPYTDVTVRDFDLRITAGAAEPPLNPGTVDYWRLLATLEWSGTAITRVDQVAGVGAVARHAATHAPGSSDPPDYSLVHLRGTLAARPAPVAANAGLTYEATDVNGGTPYRSTGSAWEQAAPGVTQAPQPHAAAHLPGGADALAWAGSIHASGTLAARPAASATNAGLTYHASDVNGGTVYRSSGVAWTQVAAGVTQPPPDSSVTTAKLAAASVTTAKLADKAVIPAKLGVIPAVQVYKAAPTVVSPDDDTPLDFPGTSRDTDGMHVGFTGYLIPQTPGLYLLSASIRWSNSTGDRDLWFAVDGSEADGMRDSRLADGPPHDTYQTLVRPWVASVGEHVEAVVRHNAPGNISVLPTAWFEATYLGSIS